MTLLFAVQAVVFVIALVTIVVVFLRLLERREQAWAIERGELVNHIQFGDRFSVRPPAPATPRGDGANEPDEIALVGTIQPPREA